MPAPAKLPPEPTEGNLRDAYHQQIRDAVKQYEEWRRQGAWGLVSVPGRRNARRIRDLTDADILAVARKESAIDMEHMLNSRAENIRNMRYRHGFAQ